MKANIVIQTDFSNTWSAVSQMKGVMKIVDPTLEIYDITHDILPYSALEASLSLKSVADYWPSGTVFVSVVDPGVGTSRKASVALLDTGSMIVTPDNGSLTHLKKRIVAIREIDQDEYYYRKSEEVNVFHGRDLFGYVAALLASEQVAFEKIGKAYDVSEISECEEVHMLPVWHENKAEGFVLTGLVHFGGIQTNILNQDWLSHGFQLNEMFHVTISHQDAVVYEGDMPFVKSFGYVEKGSPLLYQGSGKYLSIDLNQANFMKTYGISFGKEWKIILERKKTDE